MMGVFQRERKETYILHKFYFSLKGNGGWGLGKSKIPSSPRMDQRVTHSTPF
jgi:hypothetical protein